jgi:hypothetical protein
MMTMKETPPTCGGWMDWMIDLAYLSHHREWESLPMGSTTDIRQYMVGEVDEWYFSASADTDTWEGEITPAKFYDLLEHEIDWLCSTSMEHLLSWTQVNHWHSNDKMRGGNCDI